MNYIIDPNLGSSMTGMVKPKKDISQILAREGYKSIRYTKRKNRISRFLFSIFDFKKLLKDVGKTKEDTLLVQYPLYSRWGTKQLFGALRNKKVIKVAFIHDIEALRANKENKKLVDGELEVLNKFDTLIVHNSAMKRWLVDNGIKCKMIELEIFDYLNNKPLVQTAIGKPIIFAGNLGKAPFLEKLYIDKKIILFGVNQKGKYPDNIYYKGAKDPDDLPLFLDGSFGLVWDGSKVDTNSGILGEYTRYNNPHKVSLYLSSGLPVIVWSEAAIAKFVKENNVGIVVDSLKEIDEILKAVTISEYNLMTENAQNVAEKLRTGFFTKQAVKQLNI